VRWQCRADGRIANPPNHATPVVPDDPDRNCGPQVGHGCRRKSRLRWMIFGLGKSSTRVMPSVASGTYSPGPGMAKALPGSRFQPGNLAPFTLASHHQNPITLLKCPKIVRSAAPNRPARRFACFPGSETPRSPARIATRWNAVGNEASNTGWPVVGRLAYLAGWNSQEALRHRQQSDRGRDSAEVAPGTKMLARPPPAVWMARSTFLTPDPSPASGRGELCSQWADCPAEGGCATLAVAYRSPTPLPDKFAHHWKQARQDRCRSAGSPRLPAELPRKSVVQHVSE